MYRWGMANCIIMEYGFGFMLCITMALKTIEPCNYNLLNGSRLYSDYNSLFVITICSFEKKMFFYYYIKFNYFALQCDVKNI